MSMPLCWDCGRKFQPRKGSSIPYFAYWTDPLGHKHRVHKQCKEFLEQEPKPTTPIDIARWRINRYGIDDGDESP